MGNSSSKAASKVVRQFPKGKPLQSGLPNSEGFSRPLDIAKEEHKPIDDNKFMDNLSRLVKPKENEHTYQHDNINPHNPMVNILKNRQKVEEVDATYDQPLMETKNIAKSTLKPHELEDLIVKGTFSQTQWTSSKLAEQFNLKESEVKLLLNTLKPCEKVKTQPENN